MESMPAVISIASTAHTAAARPPVVTRSTFEAIGIGIALDGFGVRSV